MKILQVANSFKPAWGTGGITRVAYDVSRNLVKRGHSVTVLATEKGLPGEIDIKRNTAVDVDGIEVYYLRNASNYLAERTVTIPYLSPFVIRKRLKEFDIIHLHEYRRLISPVVHHYAQKYGVPYVLQPHTSVATYFQKKAAKRAFDTLYGNRILDDASRLIAVSRQEADGLQQIGVDGEKIHVIYNGMDIGPFQNIPAPGLFRAKYQIEGRIVLFLGRINRTKGLDLTIRAFGELQREMDDVKLVITGHDDGYRGELERTVGELGLGERVRFTGTPGEEEKLAAYVDADLFVHAVRYMGGVGIAPLEAIMCGTPVIVTRACGEIIEAADCGYFIEYGDVIGLKSTMKRALENPGEGKDMAERGKRYIAEHLTWDSVITRIENIYSDILGRPGLN